MSAVCVILIAAAVCLATPATAAIQERTRLSPKSHARLARPKTPTTRGSQPRRLEGPRRRISEPSSFGHLRSGRAAGRSSPSSKCQTVFCRRRHQARSPPLAKIRPGSPARRLSDEPTSSSRQGQKSTASRYETRQSGTGDWAGHRNEGFRSCPEGKRRARDCRRGCDA